jgi:phage antirepressor YoqD-like protein
MTKPSNYNDLPEVMSIGQAAKLLRIAPRRLSIWLHTGQTPMGEIKEGYHYYRDGVPYKIIKNRLCELFGVKTNEEPKAKKDLTDDESFEIAKKIMQLPTEKRLAIKILLDL